MPWLPSHPQHEPHGPRSHRLATGVGQPNVGFLALLLVCVCLTQVGCNLLPQRLDRPHIHNPFPQLRKVAVVPFFNQSGFPQLNGADVANSYRHQLQQIPGFEVLPIGVVDHHLARQPIPVDQAPDFQQLARDLGVDAIVVGSITDFDPYYPPRMGLAVRWYAANPSFHPIPAGYGLPWGTAEEEYIPEDLKFEAEFALAREQLKTQTPQAPEPVLPTASVADEEEVSEEDYPDYDQFSANKRPPTHLAGHAGSSKAPHQPAPKGHSQPGQPGAPPGGPAPPGVGSGLGHPLDQTANNLPADWPDPNGFVPDRPSATRPPSLPQSAPIMELIKQYDGSNSELTARLESYYAFRDDARFGGWQSYLERTDDFINFCCYLHISELLTARGGAGYARPVWRWPLATYQP